MIVIVVLLAVTISGIVCAAKFANEVRNVSLRRFDAKVDKDVEECFRSLYGIVSAGRPTLKYAIARVSDVDRRIFLDAVRILVKEAGLDIVDQVEFESIGSA